MVAPAVSLIALLLAQDPAAPAGLMTRARQAMASGTNEAYRAELLGRLRRSPADPEPRLSVALLAELEWRMTEATAHYDTLLHHRGSGAPLSPAYRVHVLLGLARAGIFSESFQHSTAELLQVAQAARGAGDRAAEAEAWAWIGWLRSRLAQMDEGLALLARADSVNAGLDPYVTARTRCVRGGLLTFRGHPAALEVTRQGLREARAVGELSLLGLCYYSLASVLINQSTDSAVIEAYLDSAIVAQRRVGDHGLLAITQFTAGYHLANRGELARARAALYEARGSARRSDSRFASAWVARFLGEIYALTGDLSSADREFRAAHREFVALGDSFAVRSMDRSLGGLALAQGHVDMAERIFQRVLAGAEAAGSQEGVYFTRLELAAVRSYRGDWAGALRELEEIAAFGRSSGRAGWLPALEISLGYSALRAGNLSRAEHHLNRALTLPRNGAPLTRYTIRSRLAEVYARRGDLTRSLAEIEAATSELEAYRRSIKDEELRRLVFQSRSGLYDEADGGLATVLAALVEGGLAARGYQLSERRRARLLRDQLARARMAPDDRARETALGSFWEHPAESPLPPAGTALIEFHAGRAGQRSSAFIVSAGGVEGVVLPSVDSLAPGLERLQMVISAGGDPARLLAAVRTRLLDPVLARLPAGTHTLMLVPDDLLHQVPFHALPLTDGQHLSDRYRVSTVPSGALVSPGPAGGPPRGNPALLALGNPEFQLDGVPGNPGERDRFVAAYEEAGGLPRLEAAASEVRAAARYFARATTRTGRAASESFFKDSAAAGYQVVHLATHALVDQQSAALTSLALAPDAREDGFLTLGELGALTLPADLVVLSGCRTAGGQVIGGEGVHGLAWPLLASGVRTVVATLWAVDDGAARAFSQDFYRLMAEGQPVGEATRRAALAARDRGEPYRNWAAFVAIGDPTLTLALRTPRLGRAWLVAALVLLAGVAAAGYARRAWRARQA